MPKAHFHPQRLHPRYGGLVNIASQLPGGLAATCITLGRLILDQQPVSSSNPTAADLEAAVIAVCGFPRTGTTFLQETASQALGAPERCWKNHDPFAIPRYTKAGLLTLIPVRDPIGTVSSWSVYNKDAPSISMLRNRLLSYTAWHRAVRKFKASPRVLFVRFDSLASPNDTPMEGVRNTNEEQSLPLRMQNFPSETREDLKTPYLALLHSNKLRRNLDDAYEVFEHLVADSAVLADIDIAAAAAA